MSIYKITGGNLCYIGSTNQKINQRYSNHKSNYKVWKAGGKMGHCSSFDIFDAVGIENCKIELLEEAETLKDREKFYIKTMECVNRNIPNRGKKEYYQDNRDKCRESKKEVIECICGGKYTRSHKARHFKSLTHITPYPQPQSQKIHPIPSETSSPPDSLNQ